MQHDGDLTSSLSLPPSTGSYDALSIRGVRYRGLKDLLHFSIVALSDAVGLCVAWSLALVLRFALVSEIPGWRPTPEDPITFGGRFLQFAPLALTSIALFMLVAAVTGAYRRKLEGRWQEFIDTGRAVGIATLFIIFAAFVGKTSQTFSRSTILLFWLCAMVVLPVSRWAARRLLARTKLDRLRALVLASDAESADEALRFCNETHFPFEACGVIRVGDRTIGTLREGIPTVDDLNRLPEMAAETDAEAAVMAVPEASDARIRAMAMCQRLFPTVVMTTPLHDVATADVELHTVGSQLVLELRHNHIDVVNRAVKRTFDLVFASAVLMVLAPLYGAIALLVKLDSEGPVLYGHRRIGKDGTVFHCLKFRTMHKNADQRLEEILRRDPRAAAEFKSTYKLKNDPRITRTGRFLRKSSLDELPQFINVVRGEMSVVGPRPIVADELVRYGDWAGNLLAARPGVTGHWQVSGRNDTTYDERVALDMHYLRNWSLSEDVRIVLKTVRAVVERANGAY